MPTLKPYTLPSRTSRHANQNLAKSMVSLTLTDKQDKKNNEGTTLYKSNSGKVVKSRYVHLINFGSGGQVIALKSATALILDRCASV
ncbi:MAG: hypothetical protein COW66_09710 [Flavobacteriaceae bacterium CG18_big_fil_WC_8_21_14_2_50_34_36]|nr:hypothetical protein [Flavobacteriia bacterium]PIQ17824.1 MAG: hypothetical protein COW66_09710 [Flavobacteriaceae bacterium CG18_big_fil_WC_8_21_14_2_50_34_36]